MDNNYTWAPEAKETDWFENDFAELVIEQLKENRLTEDEKLGFLKNDHGLFNYMVESRTTEKKYTEYLERSASDYLLRIGKEIFGTAIYIIVMQERLKKPVREFSDHEIEDIKKFLIDNDEIYEDSITLKEALGENRELLEIVFKKMVDGAIEKGKEYIYEVQYIRSFMHVMYHAGVSCGLHIK